MGARKRFVVAFTLTANAAGAGKVYMEVPGGTIPVRLTKLNARTNGTLWNLEYRDGQVSAGGAAPTAQPNFSYFTPVCLNDPAATPNTTVRFFDSSVTKSAVGAVARTLKTIWTSPLAPGLDIVQDKWEDADGQLLRAGDSIALIAGANDATITGEAEFVEEQ